MTHTSPLYLRLLAPEFTRSATARPLIDSALPDLEHTSQDDLLTLLDALVEQHAWLHAQGDMAQLAQQQDSVARLYEKLLKSETASSHWRQLSGWICLQQAQILFEQNSPEALELIQRALQDFESLEQDEGPNAENQGGLCCSLEMLASYHYQIDALQEAERALRRSLDALPKLIQMAAQDSLAQQLFVRQLLLQHAIGDLGGDRAACKEALLRAQQQLDLIQASPANQISLREQRSEVQFLLGRLQFLSDEHGAAIKLLQDALDQAQALAQDAPSEEASAAIGVRARMLGKVLVFADQVDMAMPHLQHSRSIFVELCAVTPAPLNWVEELGESEEALARAQHIARREDLALPHIEAAQAMFKRCALRAPKNPLLQLALLRLQLLHAQCLQAMRRSDEARQLLNKAMAQLRSLTRAPAAGVRQQAQTMLDMMEQTRAELQGKRSN
ncbi:hypothetical protein V8J88_11445 [Massilia sp. W12]|uniref:hypothetical protein n=1 Tax=Massilia sp. W12 TaxID=3126507 RepID=UPI0030D466CC